MLGAIPSGCRLTRSTFTGGSMSSGADPSVSLNTASLASMSSQCPSTASAGLGMCAAMTCRIASVTALSGGNQQKVVLAKALLKAPKVLLLHDCTRGVDIGTKAEIFELVARLAASGTAFLFYSSDLSELVHLCDRVAVMVDGQIAGIVERERLSEEAILRVALGHSEDQAAVA